MPPKELLVSAPEPQRISLAFQSYPKFSNRKEEDLCRKMVESLTLEELEEAGNTSYAYFSCYPKDNSFRANIALKLARRYLIAADLDFKKAKLNLITTLTFRKEKDFNNLRAAFEVSSSPKDKKIRKKIRSQILIESKSQEKYIRGYDEQNCAILVNKGRTGAISGADAYFNFCFYSMERAIACSEFNSNGVQDKVIIIEDFTGGDQGFYPPLGVQKQVVDMTEAHYPGLISWLFFVNVPAQFRNVGWYAIKPFLSSSLSDICRFETRESLKKELQSKGVKDDDNNLFSSIDMESFFNKIPFNCGVEYKL